MGNKLILAAAGLAFALPASAQSELDFMLINRTGKEIKLVEVAATGVDQWQANKVDAEVRKVEPIKAGGRATIHFDDKGCKYDVRATFADDTKSVWSNINLCDNPGVRLSYKNGTTPAWEPGYN